MSSVAQTRLSEWLQLGPLDEDLARVEQLLMQELGGRDRFLDGVTSYLAAAGGKRLRPTLTICGAYAGQRGPTLEPAGEAAIIAAVAVEMLHLGTLYHDDVLDEATLRRGVPSVNTRWDNMIAVIGGDILIARAVALAAGIGSTEATLMARTVEEVCAGQANELSFNYDPRRDEAAYEQAIAGKTAALMATSLEFGGLAVGLDPLDLQRVSIAGRELGMAFQLVDDLLDLEGSSSTIGKPAGADIVEGVYTLPVIVELRSNARLRELLESQPSADDAEAARRLVVAGAGMPATAKRAREHVDRVVAVLDEGELNPLAKQALTRLGGLILKPVRTRREGLRRRAAGLGRSSDAANGAVAAQ
jgi:heptaprenyl diphosphate synthase